MVKCGDWGCTPNPYSSHINVIYIEGVWQPLYAVDVHMDVSPPRYGCSCRPSFWNFVRNLGYSHAINHGEMRWLRLHTQPIFISHQCYIYRRCLTTFICCGCAYGRVPTTVWLLMPTYLLEFVRNLGYSQALSDGEMQWLRLHTQPIFISHQCYIYRRCLTTFICCGCAYGRVPTTLWFLMPTKLLEFCQIWATPTR
jgi:hypothetical protein